MIGKAFSETRLKTMHSALALALVRSKDEPLLDLAVTFCFLRNSHTHHIIVILHKPALQAGSELTSLLGRLFSQGATLGGNGERQPSALDNGERSKETSGAADAARR
jgi:hypothetical protein